MSSKTTELRERMLAFKRLAGPRWRPAAWYLGYEDLAELTLEAFAGTVAWFGLRQDPPEFMGIPIYKVGAARHVGLGEPVRE